MPTQPTIVPWQDVERICRAKAARIFSPSFALRGVDADDLTQIGLIAIDRVFRAKHQLSDEGVCLTGDDTPGLIGTIAYRAMIDELRRSVGDPRTVLGATEEVSADHNLTALATLCVDHTVATDEFADLRLALQQLPNRDAVVLALLSHGYDAAEIALRLGVSRGRIYQLIVRARGRLAELLGHPAPAVEEEAAA